MTNPPQVSLLPPPHPSQENSVKYPKSVHVRKSSVVLNSVGTGNPDRESGSEISRFFNGKSVFITGATGYVGSAVVEKILRSCPGVKQIFILVRPKRGCEAQNRLDNLLNSPLFDRLRAETPSPLSKAIAIPGDIEQPGLGLSSKDVELLSSQVSIVIHSAATVKFEEPIKLAMRINVEGTKSLLELAKKMKNIESVVHISTAYSNCDRTEIKETFYPIDSDPNDMIQMVKIMSDDLANFITPKIIGNKPNTYTFTKHLAEKLVVNFAQENNLPVSIVRPAIVTASVSEPYPGWVDNLNALSGFFVANNSGFLRSCVLRDESRGDLIPLDHVVNATISAAWATAKQQSNTSSQPPQIYNLCSGVENPILWSTIKELGTDAAWKYPFEMMSWYPDNLSRATQNTTLHNFYDFFLHKLPAMIADFRLKAKGKPTKFVKIYGRMAAAMKTVSFFSLNDWNFCTDNTRNLLLNQMSTEDQQNFNFDIKQIQWKEYIENYALGLRRYTLKEDDSSLEMSKKKIQKLYIMHRGLQILFSCLFLLLISFLITRLFNL